MVYTIYIDVLFILDFIIDYLILYAVGKIGGAVIFRLRLLLSAGLGASVSLLALFYDAVYSLPAMVLCAYLMVGISYGFRRWKYILIFLGASSAFGGMVFAVNYITEKTLTVSLKTLLISSVISYFILLLTFRKSATGTTKKEYVKVEIFRKGDHTELVALLDSGNSLCCPLTNIPVMVAELDALCEILSKEEYKLLLTERTEDVILKSGGGFSPIPYKTVLNSGLLPAFRADKVFCKGKERCVLIGVSKDKIAENYSGIIGIEEE